jgi:hypothetical protein
MLPFLEELLEKKLSDALGGDVSFDRVKLSPLSGKVEVLNLAAKARGEADAFLIIPRIEAKIAMARALKQEISIESLRIERPFVRLPLPILNKGHADRISPESAPSKPWQFEADDVLVIDATIEFENAAYHAIAEKVNLSLKREAGGIVVTLIAEMLRRLNPDVAAGSLKLTGQIATRDFTRVLTSSITLDGSIGPHVRLTATTTSLQSKTIDAHLKGDVDSRLLSQLTPVPTPAIAGLIYLDIDGTFSPKQITLRRGELSTKDATIELDAV